MGPLHFESALDLCEGVLDASPEAISTALATDWSQDAVASGNRGPARESFGVGAPARPGKPRVSAPLLPRSARRQARDAAVQPGAPVLFSVHPGWANVRRGGPAAHNDWCGILSPKPGGGVASSGEQRLRTQRMPASRRRSRWRSARGLDQWRVDQPAPSRCGNNGSVALVVQPRHQSLTLGPPTIAQVGALSSPFPLPLLEGCRLRRLRVFTACGRIAVVTRIGFRPHRWRNRRKQRRCRRRHSRRSHNHRNHTHNRICRTYLP